MSTLPGFLPLALGAVETEILKFPLGKEIYFKWACELEPDPESSQKSEQRFRPFLSVSVCLSACFSLLHLVCLPVPSLYSFLFCHLTDKFSLYKAYLSCEFDLWPCSSISTSHWLILSVCQFLSMFPSWNVLFQHSEWFLFPSSFTCHRYIVFPPSLTNLWFFLLISYSWRDLNNLCSHFLCVLDEEMEPKGALRESSLPLIL